jgi:VWFA-related protein
MQSVARRWIVASASLLLLCPTLIAQMPSSTPTSLPANSPPTKDSAAPSAASVAQVPVFHAETRLVVVDVVVTDKHGQPVTDLKKEDFAVTEDGKPQQLKFFEAHIPDAHPKSLPKIDLPPNQYTNFPLQKPSSSVNVVLFDTLNTPVADQMYARWQMIKFIKALPPGKPVALFSLGSSLKMIAGFTTNSDDLVAAAEKVRPAVNNVEEEASGVQVAPPDPAGPSLGTSGEMTDELTRFAFEETGFRSGDRVQQTIDAFSQIANALSGYSGRKNLLWLSEAFPITLDPDSLNGARLGNLRGYTEVLKQSAALLSSSQISVYPIDVRGVKNGNALQINAFYNTMDEIAKQTGGKAFYGTNDLKQAMEQSIERGSTYYAVAYVPENRNWDKRYRQIKIKFDRPDLKAEYRPGYYAIPDEVKPADEEHNRMVASMQPGLPEATMLLLRVQVLPSKTKIDTVNIDYGVYAGDISFAESDDQVKHAKLEFVAVAWDKKNGAAGSSSQTMDLALKPASYQSTLEHGIPAHLELELKPGAHKLRLGVLDYGSGKIGTVDVPLPTTANPPAKP